MFSPNPAFLLVQKLKSAPRAFTQGVKAEIEKKKTFQSAPSTTKMLNFMALYWPQG
jgi:hypothetical protein